MIFLNSLFGYLSLLIIVKWCTGSQADLYHVMIYMFLSPTDDLGENQLFVGQKFLQVYLFIFFYCYFYLFLNIDYVEIFPCCTRQRHSFLTCPFFHYQLLLLLSALVAVPWMLFPKPFLLKKQNEEVC